MPQRVPFPPPTACKRSLLPSTSVYSLSQEKRARTKESNKTATFQDDIVKILPAYHALSLHLCTQIGDAQKVLDSEIFQLVELFPGLLQVKVALKAPDVDRGSCSVGSSSSSGFHYRYISVNQRKNGQIPVYVGGFGTSFDYEYVSAQSKSSFQDRFYNQRTPVLIRVAVPISHAYCDDGGIVKNTFWSVFDCSDSDSNKNDDENSEGRDINLVNICHRILEMFQGPLSNDTDICVWNTACTFNNKKQDIIDSYMQQCKLKELFWDHSTQKKFPIEWLAPKLRDIVKDPTSIKASNDSHWRRLLREEFDGVYSFELFTPEFCKMLIEEVDNYEGTSLPRRRPNTMNKAGLIVNEIGLEGLMTSLLQHIISPISQVCFPHELFATTLDHHHSFVVEYSASPTEKDKFLDMHHDSSEVTLNVCLGKEFEGSGLRFCGHFGSSTHRSLKHIYEHVIGRGIIHLGRQRHGADTITSGNRMNLIVWARSSHFRNAAACGSIYPDGYPREQESIDHIDKACLSAANDDDYEILMLKP